MLENTSWKFCEMAPLKHQSNGKINFPYHYLKDATEAEKEECKNLETELKPLVDTCELFIPVELNFKWLMDITDSKTVDDYKGISYSELEDKIAVQAGNYIFSYQALIEHWKSFIKQDLFRDTVRNDKVEEFCKYMKQSMSTLAIIKALRNYLSHHARIPLYCGQRTNPDTGKIDFVIWVNKSELLRDTRSRADDKAAIEAKLDYFDLLSILKTSRQEVENLQFYMYRKTLLTNNALALRDRARNMQKRLGFEGHEFFLIKPTEIYLDESKSNEFLQPSIRLDFIQIHWGLIRLIDGFSASSKEKDTRKE